MRAYVVVALAALGPFGCGLFLGLDDRAFDGSGGAGGAGAATSTHAATSASAGGASSTSTMMGSTGGGGSSASSTVVASSGTSIGGCAAGEICYAVPGAPWIGPHVEAGQMGCAGWPDALNGVEANDSTWSCDCVCSPSGLPNCKTAYVGFFKDPNCLQPIQEGSEALTGMCNAVAAPGVYIQIVLPPLSPSCGAPMGVPQISNTPPSTLDLCAPPKSGACPGGFCAPAPPASSRICVFQNVDNAKCPQGYPTPVVYSTSSFTDTRSCDFNSCGSCDGIDGKCTLTADVFADGACTNSAGTITEKSPCTKTALGPLSSKGHVISSQGGTCIASGFGVPTGALVPNSPITLCCTP